MANRRADNDWVRLGKRLRLARHVVELSQSEAADRLGQSQAYVSRCELGQRRVDVWELEAFAELYGTTFEWLLETE